MVVQHVLYSSSLEFLSRSAILLLCCLCSFWVMCFSHLYLYLCKKWFVANARLTLKKMAKSNASICQILSISWLKSRILIMSITVFIIVCQKSNGYIPPLQFTGEIIEFLTASQMYLEELCSPKEMWTTAKYILVNKLNKEINKNSPPQKTLHCLQINV